MTCHDSNYICRFCGWCLQCRHMRVWNDTARLWYWRCSNGGLHVAKPDIVR